MCHLEHERNRQRDSVDIQGYKSYLCHHQSAGRYTRKIGGVLILIRLSICHLMKSMDCFGPSCVHVTLNGHKLDNRDLHVFCIYCTCTTTSMYNSDILVYVTNEISKLDRTSDIYTLVFPIFTVNAGTWGINNS